MSRQANPGSKTETNGPICCSSELRRRRRLVGEHDSLVKMPAASIGYYLSRRISCVLDFLCGRQLPSAHSTHIVVDVIHENDSMSFQKSSTAPSSSLPHPHVYGCMASSFCPRRRGHGTDGIWRMSPLACWTLRACVISMGVLQ